MLNTVIFQNPATETFSLLARAFSYLGGVLVIVLAYSVYVTGMTPEFISEWALNVLGLSFILFLAALLLGAFLGGRRFELVFPGACIFRHGGINCRLFGFPPELSSSLGRHIQIVLKEIFKCVAESVMIFVEYLVIGGERIEFGLPQHVFDFARLKCVDVLFVSKLLPL